MKGELIVRVDVYHDADFDDATYLPLDGTRPRDITGMHLELIILPSYDYPTVIRTLSSLGGDSEIVVDDATIGKFHFDIPQATVQSDLPVGEWVHFLNLVSGASREEIWRGPFVVNPGRVPA